MTVFKLIGGTGTWVSALLASMVTAATWAALVKSGFDIDLHGLPAAIYKNYTSIRDPIFDLLFAWLPFTLPGPVKDLATMYLALGAVSQRAWIQGEPGGNKMSFWPKLLYKARLTLTWPGSVRFFYRVISMHGLFKEVPPEHYARFARAIFWLYLITLVVSAAGATAFFTWNAIQAQALASITTQMSAA